MAGRRWNGEAFTASVKVDVPKKTAALLHAVYKTKKAASERILEWLLEDGGLEGLEIDLEAKQKHKELESWREKLRGVPAEVLRELVEEAGS